MTGDATTADVVRELRLLHESAQGVLDALDAIERADPATSNKLAFDLAMEHGSIRTIGYVAEWRADERESWLRTFIPEEPVRHFVVALVDRVRRPVLRRALTAAMPTSFRPPDASAWEAYRARLRAKPDEKIWGDPDGVGVRGLWVTPASTHHRAVARRMAFPLPIEDRTAPTETRPVDDVLTETEALLVNPRGPHLVFVVGAAGLGKSTFAMMLADRLAARADVTPVLLRLRDVAPERPLLGEIERLLTDEGFTAGGDFLLAPRIVLVLDGFDELGDSARTSPDVFILRVRELVRDGHIQAALLTGRDTLFGDRSACFPEDSDVFTLQPFDPPRVHRWAENWQRVTGRAFDTTRFALDALGDDTLREVASHPLMLYMLARMEADGQEVMAESFDGRARVYRTIINWCCKRHEELRPGDRWKSSHMRRFLRAAGYASMVRGRDVLRLDDVKDAIRALGLETGDDPARFAAERTILAFTHKGDAAQTWEFTHRSFGEFLAAEYLASVALRVVERSRGALDDDETWRLDTGEATREWLGAFGTTLVPANVERYLKWLLREAGKNTLATLRTRLGDIYRELIDETEAIEAVHVARAWGQSPSKVRGFALANVCLVGGGKKRFLPEKAHPGHFVDAYHAIRCAVHDAKDHTRIYRRVGLQGIDNRSVRDTQAWNSLMLFGIDASSCDLSGADLSFTLISGANFAHANLSRTRWGGAFLLEVDFSHADLRTADISLAEAFESNFNGADLTGANAAYAEFYDCDFEGAKFPDDFDRVAQGARSSKRKQKGT